MRLMKALWARLMVALLAAFMAVPAMATLTDVVTTEVAAAKLTLTTIAEIVILAMLGFWAVRKVGQKMGWW